MDEATRIFYRKHKSKLQGKVFEIGSLDVNGGLRDIIDVFGVDMRPGPGVDLVCPVQDLGKHFESGHFDACVSAGTLEHIEDWKGFVRVTWDLVKEGGYLVLTIASLQKKRHAYPDDYWRLTEDQIRTIYPRMTDYEEIGKKASGRCVSVGWVVMKEGELGSLDFDPIKVP
jgi:hypothetical protein